MIKKHSHIAASLILFISMSLSFSTIHNHETLNFDPGPQNSVTHTIGTDSTLCPICGYLFHIDFSPGNSVEDVLQKHPVVILADEQVSDNSPFYCNQERAPPYQA